MNKVNLTFYPNNGKKSARTGKTPIYLRLYGAGKLEVRLNTLYDLSCEELPKWNEFSQRLDVKDSDINTYLSEIAKRFKSLKNEALLNGSQFSLLEIRDAILKTADSKKELTVSEYAKKYLIDDVETNKNRSEGTKKNYRNAINQLCQYLQYANKATYKLKDFDFEEADGFKKYLESAIPSMPDKEINTEVSSSTKIKNVKPIFNRAVNEGLISKNPFERVKLKFESEELAFSLNIEQLKSIYDLDFSNNNALEFAKDFLLFMCFTGLSYSDAIAFSMDYLSLRNDNKWLYDTSRNKTGKRVKQVIISYAQQIITKYLDKGFHYPNNRVFPQLTGENINIKLKLVAALAGISENISTKTGRITCSELIEEAGLEEMLLVHSFMGWSNGKNIRRRYFSISYEKLLRFSQKFENYLSDNLIEP